MSARGIEIRSWPKCTNKAWTARYLPRRFRRQWCVYGNRGRWWLGYISPCYNNILTCTILFRKAPLPHIIVPILYDVTGTIKQTVPRTEYNIINSRSVLRGIGQPCGFCFIILNNKWYVVLVLESVFHAFTINIIISDQ